MKIIDSIHGIIGVIGICLVLLGLQFFLKARKFKETGIRTTAEVIENVASQSRDRDGSSSVMYSPVIAYTANGAQHTFTPNTRSSPPAYFVGEKVEIVYNKEYVDDVRIMSFWGVYLASNILLLMGLPMTLISCGYFMFKFGIL